jgi:hypothetical protein
MLVLWTNWSHSGILDNDDFSTRAIMFRLKCFYFAMVCGKSFFDDFPIILFFSIALLRKSYVPNKE